jgi:hypothetical protein
MRVAETPAESQEYLDRVHQGSMSPAWSAGRGIHASTFPAALWVWRYARLESSRPEADNA